MTSSSPSSSSLTPTTDCENYIQQVESIMTHFDRNSVNVFTGPDKTLYVIHPKCRAKDTCFRPATKACRQCFITGEPRVCICDLHADRDENVLCDKMNGINKLMK